MNGLVEGVEYKTKMAVRKKIVIAADCALLLGLALWGVFAIRGAKKKEE